MQSIRRARRAMLHAAVLLERDAQELKSCHTVDGRWPSKRVDHAARREYYDMIATARQLRNLAGETPK